MVRISNNLIAVLIIIFGIIVSYNNWLIYKNAEQLAITGYISKTSEITLCFNNPAPVDLICATTATVGTLYNCDLNETDKDNDTLIFADNATIFDINATTGVISFTPNSSQVGKHVINISATDDSICTNNFSSKIYDLTISEVAVAEEEAAAAAPSVVAGGGLGAAFVPEEEILLSIKIDKDLIKVTLKENESKTEFLKITNDGNTKLELNLKIKDLEEFVSLSDSSIILEPGESKLISLEFFGKYTGFFIGNLIIESNQIRESVMIILEVQPKEVLFNIKVKIPNKYKKVISGKEIEVDIAILNFGDKKPVDINLYYAIRDFDGNVITFNEEILRITDVISIVRKLKIPEDIKLGSYIFFVKLDYYENIIVTSDLFSVVEKPLIPIKIEFPLIWILIILIIVLIILTIINLREHKEIKYIIKINEILRRIKYQPKEKKEITKEELDKQLEILKADLEADIITKKTYDKQKKKIKGLTKEEFDKQLQILKADLEDGIITKDTYNKQKKKIKDKLNKTKSQYIQKKEFIK
ncbi:MAG: hypothetical protein IH934_03455 [Nanoarchaeota archaeon]|nr:hypothetical protein [Nanoarchaeota archaeon]